MILVKKKIENSDVSIIEMKEYNHSVLKEAILEFNNFKDKGIIINCNFEDSIWYITNGSDTKSIQFNFNETLFAKESKSRNLGKYQDFNSSVKVYLLYKLNDYVLSTITGILNNLKNVFNESSFLNIEYIKIFIKKQMNRTSYYDNLIYLLEFLEFYKMDVNERYIHLFSKQYEAYLRYREDKNNSLNQRELGNMESIFKLGDKIEEFWSECSEKEKEEFFPIKLWWEITTKIPLRVTEFVLTPYNCTADLGGKYYLTVRRSDLKGNSNKKISHKVELDYKTQDIEINSELYNLINEYREIVDKYDFVPNFYNDKYEHVGRREYLLSHRAYFKNLESTSSSLANAYLLDYMNPANLNYLLFKFYKNIISDKFNLKLIEKSDKNRDLLSNEIEIINLMDTRHYAFINLVLNDLEPLIIKKISGHKSVESSFHYYNHVNKFVKCYTYSMAKRLVLRREVKKDITVIQLNNSHLKDADIIFRKTFGMENLQFREVEGGKCFSSVNDYSDCRKVDNNCEICNKFEAISQISEEKIIKRIKDNNKKIDEETEALKTIIKKYKKIKNFNEEYIRSISKIKSLSNQNSELISKYVL